MAILGFTGKLPVAIGITWKGDSIPNLISPIRKDERYVVMNESVTELAVKGLFGGSLRILERKATAKNRLYDKALNLFITEPVSSSVVEQFLALPRGARLALDLTFTFNTFFDALLVQMTRADADLHNLANPNDSKAILDTFQHSAGKEVSIRYNSATQKATALAATLTDFEAKPPASGSKFPAVKLMVDFDLSSSPTPLQKEIMRKLIAMDWSKLARFGKPPPPAPPTDVDTWEKNVRRYLLNHTDITRGERFRQAILARHKGKSPTQLATDLREDLDLHLITANHWGQAREDLKTERHQRLLSDLFGTLHQKTFLSSPVSFARRLSGEFGLDVDKAAALALQYGTGHCGEHAQCSFSVLRSIMQSPGNQVKAAILSGNANIDHAFVVYHLDLDTVVATKTTNPKSNRSVGTEMAVFNLREAIAKNASRIGFVMDPYLDKSVMKPTAAELLTALNSSKRKAQGKDTDFLAFNGIHPPFVPGAVTVTDLRGRSEADRKTLVKNV